jgi:exodeoxyribonuclease VIII
VNNTEYHADTSAISASGLKLFMRSPAHYYAAYLDPNRIERQPTPAMRLGTATHCAILEPERFSAEYIALPEGLDRRTKEGKQAYADLLATGAELLTSDDMSLVVNMACAFRDNATSRALFDRKHVVEQSIFAEVNGVACKCRPDFMTADGLMVMDVKTTSDASPESFGKSAWSLGYHIQAAFYRRVIQSATGITPEFIFGCVESDRPYLTAYYTVPQYLLDYADGVIDALLEQYAECLRSGIWHGYIAEIEPQELSVPGYAQRIIEQDGIEDWEISHV